MNKLLWRIRYTVYGQWKTGWGVVLWWVWSATAHDMFGDECTPKQAVAMDIDSAMS